MRKLSLRKEVLRELDGVRLRKVAGRGLPPLTGTETYTCPTIPVNKCVVVQTTAVDCP